MVLTLPVMLRSMAMVMSVAVVMPAHMMVTLIKMMAPDMVVTMSVE